MARLGIMVVISTWTFALVLLCIYLTGVISGVSIYRPSHKGKGRHKTGESLARKQRNRDYAPRHMINQ